MSKYRKDMVVKLSKPLICGGCNLKRNHRVRMVDLCPKCFDNIVNNQRKINDEKRAKESLEKETSGEKKVIQG